MFSWVKIGVVDLPGHNVDPGDGASGYAVSTRDYLRPHHGYWLLSLYCQNLLTHAAKVDLGIVI